MQEVIRKHSHVVLYFGQAIEDNQRTRQVSPHFKAVMETSKRLMAEDGVVFKYINFKQYPERELNNLNLRQLVDPSNRSEAALAVIRRHNMRDRKVITTKTTQFEWVGLSAWIRKSKAVGPGPDGIKTLAQTELHTVF